MNTCLKSLQKVATCLNDKSSTNISSNKFDKVFFIKINTYDNYNFGQGPLNNGLLISLNYHRFGYKIFYLYNSNSEDFIKF